MGTAGGEMTLDRLLARLASLEQENARLRAAWDRRGEEPGMVPPRPHASLGALVRAARQRWANRARRRVRTGGLARLT